MEISLVYYSSIVETQISLAMMMVKCEIAFSMHLNRSDRPRIESKCVWLENWRREGRVVGVGRVVRRQLIYTSH